MALGLTRGVLAQAEIDRCRIAPRTSWPGVGLDLSRAKLLRADLSRAALAGADLTGADLGSANLFGADLTAANLATAELRNAELTQAKLSGAEWITTAICAPGSIGECRVDETAQPAAPDRPPGLEAEDRGGAV